MDLYINGHNVNSITELQYIMVQLEHNVWGTKYKFLIDVGKGVDENNVICGKDGEALDFVSQVDLMNYLFKTGWKFLRADFGTHPTKGTRIEKMYFVRIEKK